MPVVSLRSPTEQKNSIPPGRERVVPLPLNACLAESPKRLFPFLKHEPWSPTALKALDLSLHHCYPMQNTSTRIKQTSGMDVVAIELGMVAFLGKC